jgi:hypothetical protein
MSIVPPKLKLYAFKAYLNETKSDERGVNMEVQGKKER